MTGRVVAVNLGEITEAAWAGDASGRSGIDKRPAGGRVEIRPGGVTGDFIGERAHHGGPDQAVYAYAEEDADWWAGELGRQLRPGVFGENLTTSAVDVTGAVVGERWAVGSALLQVTKPRTPCRTFAGFWGVPDLIKRFTARGAPGAYLRVLRPGDVGTGDPVEVVDRPAHGVTVGEVFRAVTLEPALLPRLLDVPELPGSLREKARRRLG
ncbi:MOSC domain-containing protein [Micromonospora sp. WMMD1128]|uniref:MOSC domain-containing protein n=1 Tax=unclassified Micromonospora TaxID=2617518 RepID=UPI00248C685A|nr:MULTISPECIES: MOSC domain-containing protein [unclassified Micromonospora]WBB74980.1 MOSC domain-containing protein [Micromonospora sp. WMMD1128]WFE31645.1 MOSC domain-containing protein [Micromonospora sp. WMMD975]